MMIEISVSSFTSCYEGATLETCTTWQEALIETLKENGVQINAWDETKTLNESIAIEEKALAALAICAAYTESKKPIPAKLKAVWDEDKVYEKASNEVASKYKQLLRSVDVFLPGDFPFNFEYVDMNEEVMLFGSVDELLAECERLKRIAFKNGEKEASNEVERLALSALDTYLQLCAKAKEEQLPLFIN